MDSAALFGLLGAVVGGGATMLGSLLATRQQDRLQRARAARERREQAYGSAIRHLLRAMNRRSAFQFEGGRLVPLLAKESVAELFDDLVEAQYWLAVTTTACSDHARLGIENARELMDAFVSDFVSGQVPPDKKRRNPLAAVDDVYKAVLAGARYDLRQ